MRRSVGVNFHFMDFLVLALPLLVVVVESIVPPLKLLHVARLWPTVHLHGKGGKGKDKNVVMPVLFHIVFYQQTTCIEN